MIVRMRADSAMVPRDVPVDRMTAEWMICVEVGEGRSASGLNARGEYWDVNAGGKWTYSAKYHAPITLAQVILKMPRATPHDHSQIAMAPIIAQFAQL